MKSNHALRRVFSALLVFFALELRSEAATASASSSDRDSRPRMIVLTDFFKDPDDKQSLIRLLVSASEFELEGLVATSLAYGDGQVRPDLLKEVIDTYATVFSSLQKHARPGSAYPSPDELKTRVKAGAPVIRKLVGTTKGFSVPYPVGARDSRSCDPPEKWIGAGKDTPGSEHIIAVVDRDDPRPVWVAVWGGAMDLAQALWKVRNERPVPAVERFVQKLRVFQISYQDTGAVWLWHEFPQLFRIQCSAAMRGMYMDRASAIGTEAWVTQHIRQGRGALGAAYPKAGNTHGIKEGDSPSFLHLLARGLSDPEHPEWGGWGGRFIRLKPPRMAFVDARDRHPTSDAVDKEQRWTVTRWADAASRDFAARLEWCVRAYEQANHHPVAVLDGDRTFRVLTRTVSAGDVVTLDANGSSDPDGHDLEYRWWHYVEAGNATTSVTITSPNAAQTTVAVPMVRSEQPIHLILEVSDRGEPKLTSYRRMILNVTTR